MANVNYYVTPTTYSVQSGQTWGEQDIDYDSISDDGLLPLTMEMYPNDGYNIDASYFTIKGYEPTSTGINGERIWEQGLTTTDADGNEVTNIQLGGEFTSDVNKVIISNTGATNSIWPSPLLTGNGVWCSELAGALGDFPINSPLEIVFAYPQFFTLITSNFTPTDIIYPDDNTNLETGNADIGCFYLENGEYIFAGGRNIAGSTGNWKVYQKTSPTERGFDIGQEMHFFIFRNTLDGSIRKTYKVEFEFDNSYTYQYQVDPNEDGFQPPSSFGSSYTGLAACSMPTASWMGYMIPIGVNSITLYQDENAPGGYFGSPTESSVKVEAWLNSTYDIIGSNDIQLYLDIDGDAQPNDNTPEQLEDQFIVTVKLKEGANSNAKLFINAEYDLDSTQGFGATLNSFDTQAGTTAGNPFPSWYAEAVNVDDYSAKIIFTKNPNFTMSPIFDTNWPLNCNFFGSWFIQANSGYSVCRENFWIKTSGDYTTNTYSFGGPNGWSEGESPPRIDTTGNVYAHFGHNNSAAQSSHLSNQDVDRFIYYVNLYDIYQDLACESLDCDNEPFATFVINPIVLVEDGDNITESNLTDETNGSTGNPSLTSWGTMSIGNKVSFGAQVRIFDTKTRGDWAEIMGTNIGPGSGNGGFEFDGIWTNMMWYALPWSFNESYPPNNNGFLNPQDWTNNMVMVELHGFDKYSPINNLQTGTNMPKNFIFEIEGSAMEIPSGSMPSTNMNLILTEEIK
tara:strand:+ start:1431 stop:3638 length:2208 start_codon:yes stop_codon:yes gene_type:complete